MAYERERAKFKKSLLKSGAIKSKGVLKITKEQFNQLHEEMQSYLQEPVWLAYYGPCNPHEDDDDTSWRDIMEMTR